MVVIKRDRKIKEIKRVKPPEIQQKPNTIGNKAEVKVKFTYHPAYNFAKFLEDLANLATAYQALTDGKKILMEMEKEKKENKK